jgi:alpha-tubulin N-acetyltransferase 1
MVIGFLRVGKRLLYLTDNYSDSYIKENVICVLDFYVHYKLQKLGHGKQLFEKMLRFYNCQPYDIAYDTPSVKLMNFLYKHYSLKNSVPQANHFTVFQEYFTVRELY